MSDRIWLATKKGLFSCSRQSSGVWQLGTPHFLGDPVTYVLEDPRDGSLYAALNLGHFGVKLHRSDDGGATWSACAAPAYPEKPADPEDTNPWKLQLIWSMAAGGADQPGLIWAGTIPGGLFRSADRGASWELVRSLWDRPERRGWFGGGYDQAGIHSIMVDPRDSRHVTLGISCGGVWQTYDAGDSWNLTAKGMRAAYMPPDQADVENIQDPHCVAACTANPDVLWCQHHNGIFRSVDGGKTWQESHDVAPSGFGFAVAVHPQDPGTAWFVPAIKDERRVPVDGKFVVTRTRDGGQRFETLSRGLPQADCYDLVYRHGLAVDESGARVAVGSTTGGLWVSEDGGEGWLSVSQNLPQINALRFAIGSAWLQPRARSI